MGLEDKKNKPENNPDIVSIDESTGMIYYGKCGGEELTFEAPEVEVVEVETWGDKPIRKKSAPYVPLYKRSPTENVSKTSEELVKVSYYYGKPGGLELYFEEPQMEFDPAVLDKLINQVAPESDLFDQTFVPSKNTFSVSETDDGVLIYTEDESKDNTSEFDYDFGGEFVADLNYDDPLGETEAADLLQKPQDYPLTNVPEIQKETFDFLELAPYYFGYTLCHYLKEQSFLGGFVLSAKEPSEAERLILDLVSLLSPAAVQNTTESAEQVFDEKKYMSEDSWLLKYVNQICPCVSSVCEEFIKLMLKHDAYVLKNSSDVQKIGVTLIDENPLVTPEVPQGYNGAEWYALTYAFNYKISGLSSNLPSFRVVLKISFQTQNQADEKNFKAFKISVDQFEVSVPQKVLAPLSSGSQAFSDYFNFLAKNFGVQKISDFRFEQTFEGYANNVFQINKDDFFKNWTVDTPQNINGNMLENTTYHIYDVLEEKKVWVEHDTVKINYFLEDLCPQKRFVRKSLSKILFDRSRHDLIYQNMISVLKAKKPSIYDEIHISKQPIVFPQEQNSKQAKDFKAKVLLNNIENAAQKSTAFARPRVMRRMLYLKDDIFLKITLKFEVVFECKNSRRNTLVSKVACYEEQIVFDLTESTLVKWAYKHFVPDFKYEDKILITEPIPVLNQTPPNPLMSPPTEDFKQAAIQVIQENFSGNECYDFVQKTYDNTVVRFYNGMNSQAQEVETPKQIPILIQMNQQYDCLNTNLKDSYLPESPGYFLFSTFLERMLEKPKFSTCTSIEIRIPHSLLSVEKNYDIYVKFNGVNAIEKGIKSVAYLFTLKNFKPDADNDFFYGKKFELFVLSLAHVEEFKEVKNSVFSQHKTFSDYFFPLKYKILETLPEDAHISKMKNPILQKKFISSETHRFFSAEFVKNALFQYQIFQPFNDSKSVEEIFFADFLRSPLFLDQEVVSKNILLFLESYVSTLIPRGFAMIDENTIHFTEVMMLSCEAFLPHQESDFGAVMLLMLEITYNFSGGLFQGSDFQFSPLTENPIVFAQLAVNEGIGISPLDVDDPDFMKANTYPQLHEFMQRVESIYNLNMFFSNIKEENKSDFKITEQVKNFFADKNQGDTQDTQLFLAALKGAHFLGRIAQYETFCQKSKKSDQLILQVKSFMSQDKPSSDDLQQLIGLFSAPQQLSEEDDSSELNIFDNDDRPKLELVIERDLKNLLQKNSFENDKVPAEDIKRYISEYKKEIQTKTDAKGGLFFKKPKMTKFVESLEQILPKETQKLENLHENARFSKRISQKISARFSANLSRRIDSTTILKDDLEISVSEIIALLRERAARTNETWAGAAWGFREGIMPYGCHLSDFKWCVNYLEYMKSNLNSGKETDQQYNKSVIMPVLESFFSTHGMADNQKKPWEESSATEKLIGKIFWNVEIRLNTFKYAKIILESSKYMPFSYALKRSFFSMIHNFSFNNSLSHGVFNESEILKKEIGERSFKKLNTIYPAETKKIKSAEQDVSFLALVAQDAWQEISETDMVQKSDCKNFFAHIRKSSFEFMIEEIFQAIQKITGLLISHQVMGLTNAQDLSDPAPLQFYDFQNNKNGLPFVAIGRRGFIIQLTVSHQTFQIKSGALFAVKGSSLAFVLEKPSKNEQGKIQIFNEEGRPAFDFDAKTLIPKESIALKTLKEYAQGSQNDAIEDIVKNIVSLMCGEFSITCTDELKMFFQKLGVPAAKGIFKQDHSFVGPPTPGAGSSFMGNKTTNGISFIDDYSQL